ncbi:hypothetical protein M6D93_12140 [Jatrophihabitans telluris]|uniref:Uncharacterized protein n=1 Tax=Jatrophihabitans telluris TaxID=2038343 RepID=A0ABY4QUB3_9ACTN|nr:hypothetical protein [Jatrophihabitans telluris]UQX87055.1 hypothetical protein M6D93_12140 [Jatrophihabitans telluris]
MGEPDMVTLKVLVMVAAIVGVDLLLLRQHGRRRLMVDVVGLVLTFRAFHLPFARPS